MGTDRYVAIDIGNTHVSIGIFEKDRLVSVYQLETAEDETKIWEDIARRADESMWVDTAAVGISSVVKGKGEALMKAAPPAIPLFHLTKDTEWPISSLYSTRLGTDRMLAAIAAWRLAGAPVIVVDLGTAGTIDLVNTEGQFAGGIIIAGAGLRGRALHEFTSVLPLLEPLSAAPDLLGRDTEAAILSGLYYGVQAEVIGLVDRIREEIGVDTPVIATGTGAILFADETPAGWRIERGLNLYGIYYTLRHLICTAH